MDFFLKGNPFYVIFFYIFFLKLGYNPTAQQLIMDDLLLFKLLRQGDFKAFETLYPKYKKEFVSWLKSTYAFGENDSIEVYQQSMVILFENIRDGKLKSLSSSFKTYIFAIGRNKAREHKKKQTRLSSIDTVFINHSNDEFEEVNLREEKLRIIEECLSEISEPCKKILVDFYYFKKSISDISQRHGYKNTDSAKNQKSKCLKKFREIVRSRTQYIVKYER